MGTEVTYFAVADVAAHEGGIVEMRGPAWPADGGWTYQDVTGPHGAVLIETDSLAEAEAVLASWLDCDAARTGAYCYAHNGCA